MHGDELKRLVELRQLTSDTERTRESRRWFIRTLAAAGIGGVLIHGRQAASVIARRTDCSGGVNTCSIDTCAPNTCSVNTCGENTCSVNICTASNTCSYNKCDQNQCKSNECFEDTATTCNKTQKNTCDSDLCFSKDMDTCSELESDTCTTCNAPKNIIEP
jgi:hypothetical protein